MSRNVLVSNPLKVFIYILISTLCLCLGSDAHTHRSLEQADFLYLMYLQCSWIGNTDQEVHVWQVAVQDLPISG